jgi:ZIP family zinc transporter
MPPALRHAGAALLSRRAVGVAIVLGGMLVVLDRLWQGLLGADPRVGLALQAGLLAAGATALGTLPVALALRTSERARDTVLGFGAGVMLAACAFSLIVPALAASRARGAGAGESAGVVAVALLLGAFLLLVLDRWLPHEHFIKGREGGSLQQARHLKRTWLFVFAVTLHNLPEGLAIGAAYGGSDALHASALATGIAIQDVPEGLVIALALMTAGYRRRLAVLVGAASGLAEPAGAVFGAAVVTTSTALLPWGLAFAAGSMLFVISHEIIPESHRQGHERWATCGLLLGFVLMMGLDTALG